MRFKKLDLSLRNWRLLLAVVTAVSARFVGVGVTLITVPITLNYLGAEHFGVWVVISGFIAFIFFGDFGLGMGLQNALSRSYGKEDNYSPKLYISSAYALLFLVSVVLVVFVYLVFEFFSLNHLFKSSDSVLVEEAVKSLKYSLIMFFILMPTTLIERVLAGRQKLYVANVVLLVGNLFSLLAIFVAINLDLGLLGLSILFVCSTKVVLLVYSLFYFFFKERALFPNIKWVKKKYIKNLIATGGWAVMVQLIYASKINLPTIIVSSTLGLIAVGEYTVVQKLMGLSVAVLGVAIQSLWSVYGEAYASGDKKWVQSSLRKSVMLTFIASTFAAVMFYLFGIALIDLWLSNGIKPSRNLILCFSLWMIAHNVNVCFSMVLNGTNNFKNQAIFMFCLVFISLLIISNFSIQLELVGVVLVLFLISELLILPFMYLECRRVISKLK